MGRILGLDYGLRRVGVALSDPDRRIASPLEVYERRADRPDADHFRRIVEDYGVDRVVVGLPAHGHGVEGEAARRARSWGRWLGEQVAVPVVFFDERYTTVEAEDLLRSAGLKAGGRRARRDMIAAQVLLQNYLDAGSPEVEAPAAPLDDDREGPPEEEEV